MNGITNRLAVVAMLAAPAVFAAQPGPYFGAGVGYADVLSDDQEEDLYSFIRGQGLDGNINDDTDNLSYKVFGGYQLTSSYGFELAYMSLGGVDLTANITQPNNATVNIETDGDAFEFVATGSYPVSSSFDLEGRLGGLYYNIDADVAATGPVNSNYNPEDDGVAFTVGVGFAFQAGTNWVWRGGWQYVDTDLVENLFQTSLAYRFGH